MPPLQMPPDVPLGLWWYVLLVSINGVFFYLLRMLGDPQGHLKNKAEREIDGRLPSLNEHLWRLVKESETDPYEGTLQSVDDLVSLWHRIRRAYRPMLRYSRLRRNIWFGHLACDVAILGAILCGAVYLLQYPACEWIIPISIVALSVLTIWSFWHLVRASIYYFFVIRRSDED